MKKLLIITIIILSLSLLIVDYTKSQNNTDSGKGCPRTKMTDECLKCHTTPSFKLKEPPLDETQNYPTNKMRILNGKGYYYMNVIDDSDLKVFLDYLSFRKINHAVIEIHSPGGGLFAASRITNLLQHWGKSGRIVETRVYGFALSGGFLIMIAGTPGYRFVSKYSDIMWHEIISIEMFAIKISTPSDKEEEARILRHLQDVRNRWIASKGKLSKEEIDEKVRKKEWWMTGIEAVKFGFADKFLEDLNE